MRKLKRITALLLSVLMILTITACGKKDSADNSADATPAVDQTQGSGTDGPVGITVNLHYLREDDNYDGWNAWLWTSGDGAQYDFSSEADENGVVTTGEFPAGTESVGFIVRLNEWEAKDTDSDRFIDTSEILAGTVDVYVTSGEEEFKTEFADDCITGMGVTNAFMSDDFKTISVYLTEDWTDDSTLSVIDGEGATVEAESIEASSRDSKKVVITFAEELDAFGVYQVVLNGLYKYDVQIPDIYSTEAFENEFTYNENDLGAVWTKDSTTFKVWAPTADEMKLNLYKSGDVDADDLIETVSMKEDGKGVWSATVDGDMNKTYYTYTAIIGSMENEACDPYAKAVGVNGNRAMVIDLSSTNPAGWDNDSNPNSGLDYTDASIYELHIRDLSSDESSGITNVGKYLGLTEKGTVNSAGISTGLDHILDLGVTHVQLNPVYDYATVDETKLDTAQYNWGYDPKNYNAPEGSYSTDPYNGDVRISEFKTMVKTMHDNGLSVVMDVVYNHTYSTDFCFNKIVPEYFYRANSNGSGCGNDVASERAMVRRYIVDSVVYWAKEYHIDGFRFDLVGLIDTQTINEIRAELDKIDPSIILYGEGWSMTTAVTKDDTYLAVQSQVGNLNNFGMFNDSIRDAIKGSVFDPIQKGYVNGDISKVSAIEKFVSGKVAWSSTPSQQITYASCHDNMTLWDEINSSNADDSYENRIKQNLLSASIVYTSQGIPFILAGEEILRSKDMDSNSYCSSDAINSIKWDDLNKAEYKTVYEYYKGLIAFRKAHASLTLMNDAQSNYTFMKDLDEGVIAYELAPADGEVSNGLFVVYNPLSTSTTVELPSGTWTIYVQGDKAGTTALGTATGSITVDAISSVVLVKE